MNRDDWPELLAAAAVAVLVVLIFAVAAASGVPFGGL